MGHRIRDGDLYKIAVIADATAMNELKNREMSKAHHLAVEKANAEAAAATLEGKSVRVTAKAGANGRLFGTVTAKEVSAAIKQSIGCDVDKKKISLKNDIKAFGDFSCEIRFTQGVTCKLNVSVVEE